MEIVKLWALNAAILAGCLIVTVCFVRGFLAYLGNVCDLAIFMLEQKALREANADEARIAQAQMVHAESLTDIKKSIY